MNVNQLSPDEISGLLGRQKKEGNPMPTNSLLPTEKEALMELLAVSLGGSSGVLSELLGKGIAISPPVIAVKQRDAILSAGASPFFVVLGEYTGDVNGIQILSINKEGVQRLVESLEAGSDPEDMEKQFQVLQKVVEVMFQSVSKSISMVLEQKVVYSLSGMDVVEKQQDFPIAKFTSEEWFVEAGFQVKVEGARTASFELGIPVQLAKQMAAILIDEPAEEYAEETQDMEFQKNNQTTASPQKNDTPNIQSVQFSSFDDTAYAQGEPNNLNMLLDIPLQVTVELGRTKRMVKEILNVSHGSIIELDKLAGEPVDILINNKVIAVGEVVVIDENFGVRVTDILSTADRISKLR
jgi:flagellar motor switch protein FliN/FliY